jgi:hypothetical protein
LVRNLVPLPASSTKRGRGVVLEALGFRLGRDQAIRSRICIQNQHELVRSHSACIWCWDKSRANSDSHDTPRPGLGGSHHLPPYTILCSPAQRLHPNGSFSRDSQGGVPKLSRFGLLGLWASITSRPELGSGRGLKQSCSSPRELSNAMSHSRCKRRKKVDSRLLVVGSQIVSLTPGPSFAHNLGCKCPNGQCEASLDI